MALNTATERRSSVAILLPWAMAPPSPTDSPGTLDEADRAHASGVYSGLDTMPPGLLTSASARRSSVQILQPWQVAPPSPLDSPAVLDAPDRAHVAWTYSGISSGVVVSVRRYEWRAAFNIWRRSSV